MTEQDYEAELTRLRQALHEQARTQEEQKDVSRVDTSDGQSDLLPQTNTGDTSTLKTACPNCGCDYETAADLRAWKDGTLREWEPIETAPKDGTLVLLYWSAKYGIDVIEVFACGEWHEYSDGSKGWVGESFYATHPRFWTRLVGERPTHWMPFPKAPEAR